MRNRWTFAYPVCALLIAAFVALQAAAPFGYAATVQREGASSVPQENRAPAAPVKKQTGKAAAQQGSQAASVSGTKKSKPARKAAKGAPKKAPRVVRPASLLPPPATQLLLSAGRAPAGPQPEAGFVLAVPGEVFAGEPFAVRFGADGLQTVTIAFRGKSLTLRPGQAGQPSGVCEAMFSVPLKEAAPVLPITFTAQWENGKKEIFAGQLPVGDRVYPVQRLKVAQKYVTPDPAAQEQIKRDREAMRAALSRSSSVKYWTLPFSRPVPGVVTSLYGLRRFFNGEERNAHRGVDFDAMAGDPVAACEEGIIVLAEEQYYGGNTIVVDHGLNVFSLYLHLSAINVAVGDTVARGQVVGLIGSTGRSTGPHLHLSLSVQGESVNAARVIEGMEKTGL